MIAASSSSRGSSPMKAVSTQVEGSLEKANQSEVDRGKIRTVLGAQTMQTAELLKHINETKTVVVVEHDMTFVRELGVKVTCLHEGSVLAEGTIDQVSTNDRVVEVYLGR